MDKGWIVINPLTGIKDGVYMNEQSAQRAMANLQKRYEGLNWTLTTGHEVRDADFHHMPANQIILRKANEGSFGDDEQE